jgi:hypothetical protein
MNTDDTIVLLAADPATAYREYLYRPSGQFARWIDDWFDVVARPGRPISQAPRAGDVLLQVTLGRMGYGRCFVVGTKAPELAGSPRRLPAGQLLLRPRQRAEMSDPRPVEPTAEAVAAEMGLRPTAETADTGNTAAVEYDWGEYDSEDRTPAPVDTAVTVPSFDPAERAAIGEPLLSAQKSAKPAGDAGRGGGGVGGSGAVSAQLRSIIDELLAGGAARTDVDALLGAIPHGDATEGPATEVPDADDALGAEGFDYFEPGQEEPA